jgi:hypothetical protein
VAKGGTIAATRCSEVRGIGALSAGLIADWFGLAWAINAVAALTFISGASDHTVVRSCGILYGAHSRQLL